MKIPAYVLLIPFLLAAGCKGSGEKEAVNLLYDQVMNEHDEIMPKMGELMSLKKNLATLADSLKSVGSDEAQVQAEELEASAAILENSHQGMMSWMREFNNNFEGMAQDEVIRYLEEQKRQISEVGVMTDESISKARKLLNR